MRTALPSMLYCRVGESKATARNLHVGESLADANILTTLLLTLGVNTRKASQNAGLQKRFENPSRTDSAALALLPF